MSRDSGREPESAEVLLPGRDVPNEVAKRLRNAGFATELIGDGVLATKTQ